MNSLSIERRVLELAAQLWDIRSGLTVDHIDGEFYWRICRGDLVERLEALLAEDHDDDFAEFREAPSEGVWTDYISGVFDHLYQMEQAIPAFLLWIDGNRPPRMRDPLFEYVAFNPLAIPAFSRSYQAESQSSGSWVFLGVRDSQWRGDDVERALREEVAVAEAKDNYLKANNRSRLMPDEAVMIVDLKFYGAGAFQFTSDWPKVPTGDDRVTMVESPVILCTVAYPLPPKGIIAAMYDAIAIKQHAWHTRLYGAGVSRNQTVEVAIRTWTIGLLVGAGLEWRHIDRVTDEVFRQPVSSPGFQPQRDELVKRVPEAQPFVFQRPRRRI